MIIGSAPWKSASIKDPAFVSIMDGNIIGLLATWQKLTHCNAEIIHLFNSFFKYEKDRITLKELKRNRWIYPQHQLLLEENGNESKDSFLEHI